MSRIAVLSQDGKSDFPKTMEKPWCEFWKVFELAGIEIVSYIDGPEIVIFNNINWRNLGILVRFRKVRKILIVWEPKVSNPLNHSRLIRRQFDRVFVFSQYWKLNNQDFLFNWPQNDEVNPNFEYHRRKEVVMISSKKMSFVKGELYSSRIEAMRSFGRKLDLYGYGWKRSNFQVVPQFLFNLLKSLPTIDLIAFLRNVRNIFFTPECYKGQVGDKLACMREYKFAIIIENSADYVSEKLIDALHSGCVPLYVGPRLDDFNIPSGVAKEVDLSKESVFEAFCQVVDSPDEQKLIIRNGRDFITSKEFSNAHSNSIILSKLATKIVSEIRAK
jgi:hypothetical protein